MGLDCFIHVTRHSGLPADQFNCEPLYLTEALVEELEADWLAGRLTPTDGFFFGSANSRDEINEALVLLLDAHEHGGLWLTRQRAAVGRLQGCR
ncbi:hypothetical protein NVV93_10895 [Pseudomonas sp. LS44]|uniref:hypothetical protein n=1 Tax=Pseudomonas sp. LS44 TaxID=1357074 RepID=UPI00215A72D9|nr:hypothetical protein [Pseudomonas sp. LS44]UVE16145.1 hypothetical protein NVV93_10895 [Pseudomonas sp. LS44]